MLVVKQRWLNYSFNDFAAQSGSLSEEMHERGRSALGEAENEWNTIMTDIKKMLVAAHYYCVSSIIHLQSLTMDSLPSVVDLIYNPAR